MAVICDRIAGEQAGRHMRVAPRDGASLLGIEIDFCEGLGDPAYAATSPVCGTVWRYAVLLPEAWLSSLDTRAARERTRPRLAQP
jgi:hypothetical protein